MYISRYGDFCAHDNDDNDDTTDYFTPCACARGNKWLGAVICGNMHVNNKPCACIPFLLASKCLSYCIYKQSNSLNGIVVLENHVHCLIDALFWDKRALQLLLRIWQASRFITIIAIKFL